MRGEGEWNVVIRMVSSWELLKCYQRKGGRFQSRETILLLKFCQKPVRVFCEWRTLLLAPSSRERRPGCFAIACSRHCTRSPTTLTVPGSHIRYRSSTVDSQSVLEGSV